MTHDIIKTDNYLLVVDESEIREGDWFLNTLQKNVYKNNIKYYNVDKDYLKKIIAHLPLNNSAILQGIDLLPSLEQDDVEELFPTHINGNRNELFNKYRQEGYNKAKEKYKYTEEDIIKGMRLYAAWISGGTPSLRVAETAEERHKQILQSLSQPKMPIGFECETTGGGEYLAGEVGGNEIWAEYPTYPKTKTNSQGQKVLVGKYVYE